MSLTWNEILTILQMAATPILGAIAWFLKGLYSSVRAIELELKLLNGRMVKIEEWRDFHDHLDDQRDERATADRRELRDDLRRVQDAVQRQISELRNGRMPNGTQG